MRGYVFGLLSALVLFFGRVSVAEDDGLRIITTGWNAPTIRQFARDAEAMQDSPFAGAVLQVRNDGTPKQAFRRAFSGQVWESVSCDEAVEAMRSVDAGRLSHTYLLVNTDPGDVDWQDDRGWEQILVHVRLAARTAKRCGMRGLLLDAEPYSPPHRQFDVRQHPAAESVGFADYRQSVRRRGQQFMAAIVDEFPECELFGYFLLSYLVRDHKYRGDSPVDAEDREAALANHSYGLLPAFMDGWCDAIGPGIRLIDGCENAYWFEESEPFGRHAQDVRERSPLLLSEANREVYRERLTVAMPIFLDAYHPTLVGKWTLAPQRDDRLALLRQNLEAAAEASDGIVWIYSERGRWWPPAGETELWPNKDVYPPWDEVLPGCGALFADLVQSK